MTISRATARAAGATALALGVLAGCAYVDSNPGVEEAAAPGGQAGVTVERVLEATEYVEGRTVTVDAVVVEGIADTAMTVTGATSGAGPLLVVHEPGYDPVEGSDVRVTGVVGQAFDQQAVEAELGVDYDEELFARFAAGPYLTALTIDDVPG